MNQHALPHLGSFFIEGHLVLLIMLVLIAAWFDIKSRRISNWLVLSGLIASLGSHIMFGNDIFAMWGLGFLAGLGMFLPLHLLRAMGAGDVKLMAMVGAFLGPVSIVGVVLMTLIAGGALAIAVTLWSGTLRHTLKNIRFMLTHTLFNTLHGGGLQIEAPPVSACNLPYAVAIAAGTFIHIFLVRSGHALFV